MKLNCIAVVVGLLSTIITTGSTAHAQGTAFTYQGRLNDASGAVNGNYDATFTLYNGATNGSAIVAGPVTNLAVAVSNGLFTTTIDLGNVFDGTARWLQIGVRTNGAVNFIALAPRQAITPTPYAVTAGNVTGVVADGAVAGTYGSQVTFGNGDNQFTGTFNGEGGNLNNVNAASLNGLGAGSFWHTTGNSGTSPLSGNFLGTLDEQPLEIWVNNSRGFRVEPPSSGIIATKGGGGAVPNLGAGNEPNIIGGGDQNYVYQGSHGSVIAGGGSSGLFGFNAIGANYGAIGGGQANFIQSGADFSVIAGGAFNTVQSGLYSFIGGGVANTVQTDSSAFNSIAASVIAGGDYNTINTDDAFIGGGFNNSIQSGSRAASVMGGWGNIILNSAAQASIVGGYSNQIQSLAVSAFIGGGSNNVVQIRSVCAFIGGGVSNQIATVEIGSNNYGAQRAVIAGGNQNQIQAFSDDAVIGGGAQNLIQTNANGAVIGGGLGNSVTGTAGTVPGGQNNRAGSFALAAGNRAKADHAGAFVWADAQDYDFGSTATNEASFRSTGGARFVTAIDGTGTPTAGVTLAAGGAAWATISDQNAKKNFAPVNGGEVLTKLATVPVQQWNYKWEQDAATPNIGPMAQAFKAAFYPGRDDKSITTLEFDGVELAAIQGLNKKLETEAKQKDAKISELEKRLDELEQMVHTMAARK